MLNGCKIVNDRLAKKLFLGLTCFLVSGDIPISSPISSMLYWGREATLNKLQVNSKSSLPRPPITHFNIFKTSNFK